MSKNIFITATGTDIGKTYVSALIVKKMRESGLNCGYFKPVLSGVVEEGGRLKESDCNFVVNTAKIPTSADDCVVYWWKEADTYKVGTTANSCSTMHKIHDKEFTYEDFSCEHLIDSNDEGVIDAIGAEYKDEDDVIMNVTPKEHMYHLIDILTNPCFSNNFGSTLFCFSLINFIIGIGGDGTREQNTHRCIL